MLATHKYESSVSGDQCDYLVISELPTKFRSYGDVRELYIRGLFYEESLALSRYVGSGSAIPYAQLASIYSDVIRGVNVNDLEIVDFTVAMIISSIWTVDDYGWDPNIRCANTLASGLQCTGVITDRIVLDDFDFEDPLIQKLPIPLTIKGVQYNIGALTIGDLIARDKYKEEHPEIDPKVVDYAFLIKNPDISIDDKIKVIRFSSAKQINQIKDIDSEITIKINPINKKCSSCGHVNKLKIGLTQIRGYP